MLKTSRTFDNALFNASCVPNDRRPITVPTLIHLFNGIRRQLFVRLPLVFGVRKHRPRLRSTMMGSSKHACISALVNLETAVSMVQRLVENAIGSVDHKPSYCTNRNAHCAIHSRMTLEYIMNHLNPSDPFRRYYQPKILYVWSSSMHATFLNNFVFLDIVTLRKT
jgi:hypothetical protein